MSDLLHELVRVDAERLPEREAVRDRHQRLDYAGLWRLVERVAGGLCGLGLRRGDRVGVYLPKSIECVAALFGIAAAGGVLVPINPLLREEQVRHILADCGACLLITSAFALERLAGHLDGLTQLEVVVHLEARAAHQRERPRRVSWGELVQGPAGPGWRVIDTDRCAILYTSGSTGQPKGVVLSHRNLTAGARSVAGYLGNQRDDRILAALPLSFDYGLSQLTTAFHTGACAVLLNYLTAAEAVAAIAREGITGLAGVPPMWFQLAQQAWPPDATESLRYITNSGGAMPRATLARLRELLPGSAVYLMYGLTEAFRSTYLPPQELERRPDSIGKAIPNAEILVLREDGSACAPGEPGELVHRGALVAQGYWNDPRRSAERFRPLPAAEGDSGLREIAVWSGDTVRMDEDGFLYFVGRRDEMIKTSGYRVSPTEIEEVLYAAGAVTEAVAFGVPHPALGQVIVAVVAGPAVDAEELLRECRARLPRYMVPAAVQVLAALPRTPNGKLDRVALRERYGQEVEPVK